MYKFSEIRKGAIPTDANDFIKRFAARLGCTAMGDRIVDIESAHLFGTLSVLDNTGFIVAECSFRDGVCPTAMLERESGVPLVGPFRVRFRESKRNKNVIMDKETK
jgi:hypothetical protein